MPKATEPADVVLVDTQDNNRVRVIDQTRGWNFQQGTMFYWNPDAPETQLFFNDGDPATGRVFAVLYDVAAGKRIREYRFDDVPVGNGGVCQTGGKFAAINYGRLARLRLVTGYLDALDATADQKHPDNDGVFIVDIATGRRKLIVSFAQLAEALRPTRPDIDERDLFINHTLWDRAGDRLFFFARADFYDKKKQVNVRFIVDPDGGHLTILPQDFGGHPDWADGHRMIGAQKDRQAYYDTDRKDFDGPIGNPDTFPSPGGDISLSPDGNWLCNGYHQKDHTLYIFYRLKDGLTVRSGPISHGGVTKGDLRVDPAPCWNRTNTAIAIPAIASDGTRQTFILTLKSVP
jgi:hypothetical protein